MIFTPARDEIVGRLLRRRRRHGEHADDDVLVVHQLGRSLVLADRHVADGRADLRRVLVEDGGDVDAVLGEDRGARDRLAEAARADERDVVLALRPEDLADLAEQRVDVVADAALAELAERRQVAADLRRVDVRVLGDLLRGDARSCPSSAPASAPGGTGTGGPRRRPSSGPPHVPPSVELVTARTRSSSYDSAVACATARRKASTWTWYVKRRRRRSRRPAATPGRSASSASSPVMSTSRRSKPSSSRSARTCSSARSQRWQPSAW